MDPRQHFDKVLVLPALFGVLAGCSQARDTDIVDDILWATVLLELHQPSIGMLEKHLLSWYNRWASEQE